MSIDIVTVVTDYGWDDKSRPDLKIQDDCYATLDVGGHHACEIHGKDKEELIDLLEGWRDIFEGALGVLKGPVDWCDGEDDATCKPKQSVDEKMEEVERISQNSGWAGQDASEHINTLSRFLPKMPDDLSALPDGWVYVGTGNVNQKAKSFYIAYFFGKKWFYGGWSGCETAGHYAVRIDAPDDIWARFGLMPYEDLFFEHTPGDPMPNNAGKRIDFIFRTETIIYDHKTPDQHYWNDGIYEPHHIIGWRPADWLKRRDSVKGDTE